MTSFLIYFDDFWNILNILIFDKLREAIFKNHAGPKIDPFKFWANHHYYFFLNLRHKKRRKNEFHQNWTMFWSPTTHSNKRMFLNGKKI